VTLARSALLLALVACNRKPPADAPPDGGRGGGDGRTAAVHEWTKDPVEVRRDNGPIVPVTAVAMSVEGDVERVTITFDAGLPGYTIGYVDAPTHCGSGEPAAIDGTAWLEIAMTPAVAHNEEGQPLVGPIAFDATTAKAIQDIEPTCDFEGHVTWVIGVDGRKSFSARELLGPQRLEVDVKP